MRSRNISAKKTKKHYEVHNILVECTYKMYRPSTRADMLQRKQFHIDSHSISLLAEIKMELMVNEDS